MIGLKLNTDKEGRKCLIVFIAKKLSGKITELGIIVSKLND